MKLLVAPIVLAVAALAAGTGASAAPDSERVKSVLEAQPRCGNFVRFDDASLYLGFGQYRNAFEEPRLPTAGRLRVAPLDGAAPFELTTNDAAVDLVADGPTVYVLTYTSIEEWDLAKRARVAEYKTTDSAGPLAYKQHAEGMARSGDKLIIAHGRLGVSIFDLKTKRLTKQFRLIESQLPLESMATGVTVQGNLAYVVMDNFHLTRPGDGIKIFRGIVVVDMTTETVRGELGGMDPGADGIVADAGNVIVSFGGNPIWKYARASLNGANLPEPRQRLWRFPVNGHPTGLPAMDAKYYYTCYAKAPAPGENGGVHRNVPLALDRRVLMLD